MPTRVPGRPSSFIACCAIAIGVLPGLACSSGSSQSTYPAQYPQQPLPAATTPGAPSASPLPPGQSAPLPAPGVAVLPVVDDPINAGDLGYLRGQSQSLLNELVATLPPAQQQRVAGIPLVVDSTPGDVNAFATCTQDGKAAMAITDGLLDIQAHLARARAYDETAHTSKVDQYIQLIAHSQQPNQPIVQPPAGFFDPAIDNQPQKLSRQREVLDEEIAFVLGHELAHHYLGHLPCTGAGDIPLADVGRMLSGAVPLFNQPNEIAADMNGLNDCMTTGARRNGYHFTEGGALLTMQFFSGLDQFSAEDILFAFERDHPPPALRTPIIQQTANAWRATGGRGLPYPFF